MSIDRLIIERATITAGDQVRKYEISQSISDIIIYEHIDKPYLTGSVSFLDTVGVFDTIQFKGLEQLFLTLKYPEDDKPSISRKFIIDKLVDTAKNNDNSELVTFHIIEEIGFISAFLNVNKAYSGNSRSIIENIVSEFLPGYKLSTKDEDEAFYPMKLVVPNMTPFEAANWIKDRTTSSYGTPFYFFSTLGQPNTFHFLPLSTLIAAQGGDKKEYTYSQSTAAQASLSNDITKGYYNIQAYVQQPLEISQLIDAGLISSRQGYWDTSTSSDTSMTFEIENVIGLTPGFVNRDEFKFKNKYKYVTTDLNKVQSRKQYAIHSSYPYPNHVSFREIENLNRVMTAKAIRNILVTGSMDIVVSGRNFMISGKNKTIGNLINLRFLNNASPTNTTDIYELTDKVKSGKHMIYAARHNIRVEKYDVTLTCVKLENLKK